MNIGGPSPILHPVGPQNILRPDSTNGSESAQHVASPVPAAETSPAPAGVNAELWSVLTRQEKEFFMQQSDLGSLTYAPTRSSPQSVDAPRGQRIDVSV